MVPGDPGQTGLLALLGGEGLQHECALLRSVLKASPVQAGRIGLVPAALGALKLDQREYRVKQSLEALSTLQANLLLIPLYARPDADNEVIVNQFNEVDLLYIMSGQPQALVSTLADTMAHHLLQQKIKTDGMVVSAGASSSACSSLFPASGQNSEPDLPVFLNGLSLVTGLTILPFWDWLLSVGWCHRPEQPGSGWTCGIGVEAAVIFRAGTTSTTGSGPVVFISPDGREYPCALGEPVDPLLIEAIRRSSDDRQTDQM